MVEPRWEANVYPLYFLYAARCPNGKLQDIYRLILEDFHHSFPDTQQTSKSFFEQHCRRISNAEIDLLIEDRDYFLFIEAKDPKPGQRVRFSTGEVHQLVCQFVQGKLLERVIGKKFLMATLGVGVFDQKNLSELNRALISAMGRTPLIELCDFDWGILNRQDEALLIGGGEKET